MDVFGALADPVRRAIVELLDGEAHTAGQVATAFGQISRPAVSRHLRVLREAGLVDVEPSGRERIYRTRAAPLAEVQAWMDRLDLDRDRRDPAVAGRAVPGAPAASADDWGRRFDGLGTEVHRTRRQRAQNPGAAAGPPTTTEEQSA